MEGIRPPKSVAAGRSQCKPRAAHQQETQQGMPHGRVALHEVGHGGPSLAQADIARGLGASARCLAASSEDLVLIGVALLAVVEAHEIFSRACMRFHAHDLQHGTVHIRLGGLHGSLDVAGAGCHRCVRQRHAVACVHLLGQGEDLGVVGRHRAVQLGRGYLNHDLGHQVVCKVHPLERPRCSVQGSVEEREHLALNRRDDLVDGRAKHRQRGLHLTDARDHRRDRAVDVNILGHCQHEPSAKCGLLIEDPLGLRPQDVATDELDDRALRLGLEHRPRLFRCVAPLAGRRILEELVQDGERTARKFRNNIVHHKRVVLQQEECALLRGIG
mmetsp:Transcript_12743/g.28890  ORF Transcript_12743/g.28890 Transcript_12743/m.28890 type:complete len:330 (+) Transcript_12743:104-1093(+)